MDIKEKDLYQLGETLEAKTSVLQVALNYDANLDSREYSRTIEQLYDECLTDYVVAKTILDGKEDRPAQLSSSTSQNGIILEDDTSWIRLEYDGLGDELEGVVRQHQERIQNTETQSGRERLEDAMTEYEALAWSTPPSYELPLDQVDVPPKERDESVILEESYFIE